jgi:hypothetical protein
LVVTDHALARRLAAAIGARRRRTNISRKLAEARVDPEAMTAADVAQLEAALAELGSVTAIDDEYVAAFAAYEQALAAGPRTAEIVAASHAHADLVADRREIDEAIAAGRAAETALDALVPLLDPLRRRSTRTPALAARRGPGTVARDRGGAGQVRPRARRPRPSGRRILGCPGPGRQAGRIPRRLRHLRLGAAPDAARAGRPGAGLRRAAERHGRARRTARQVVADLAAATERRRALVEGSASFSEQ